MVSEVRPRWPFRLPGYGGRDGILRAGGGSLTRLLHVDDEPAVVRVRQPARERVVFAASAADRATAEEAVARMRFALAVDDDLRPFYERFRFDPLLGRALRARPQPPRPPPPRAVRGAGVGDLRAAHRVRARGGDPAPHRPALGPALRAHRPARRAHPGAAGGRGARGARIARPGRGPRPDAAARRRRDRQRPHRPARARPRARLAAPAGHPRRRRLDGGVARAARPGSLRPASGRRPRLPQARRPPAHGEPARPRRGGRGA